MSCILHDGVQAGAWLQLHEGCGADCWQLQNDEQPHCRFSRRAWKFTIFQEENVDRHYFVVIFIGKRLVFAIFIYACTSFGNFSILHLLLLGGRRRQFSPFICIVRLTKTGSAISVFSAAIKARLQFIGREETKYSPFYNKHTDTQGKGELPEF